MKLIRNVLGISAVALIIISAVAVVRFVARAADTPAGAIAGIHIDSTPLNRDLQSGNSYSPVVKKVAPSVVNIYSSRLIKEHSYRNPMMADPFFRQFFGDLDSGRELSRRENWLGSGIVVTPDGYILTANHVVEGADKIQVGIGNDKAEYSARVIGMDPPTDVAILKIDAKNLPAVTLGDSDQLEVGDVVLAIGNPLGVGQTVTRGIISALGRSLADSGGMGAQRQYQSFIQTDAAINQGNSGGALVDGQGRLIGINDAILSANDGGVGITGIGFAVPINLARSVMEGFLNGGKVARGYLGVDPQDIDAGLARGLGAPDANGALVADVTPGSPAANAGLVSGDIIVSINSKPITGADHLRVIISELRPGTKAELAVYRNGTPKTFVAVLGERPDAGQTYVQPDQSSPEQPAKTTRLGIEVQDLDSQLRLQLGMPQNAGGALVNRVDHDSNWYEAGLRYGDVITEINRQPVATAKDALDQGKAAHNGQLVVKIWRPLRGGGGITRYLSVDTNRSAN